MSLKEGKGGGTSEGFEGEKGKGNDVVVLSSQNILNGAQN